MRKTLFTIILLLCVSCYGVYIYPPQPETRPEKEFPKYLLVLRYWGLSSGIIYCDTGSDSVASNWEWTYLYETYDSLDEVMNRLNTYTGGGLENTDNLVGLWELGNNLVDELLHQKKTEHIEPEHIKERTWTEYKWELKGCDKDPNK